MSERFLLRIVFVLWAFLVAWFTFGAAFAPWGITVGAWWPASVILGFIALIFGVGGIWAWRALRP